MKRRYYVVGMKPSDSVETNPSLLYYLRWISVIQVYKRYMSERERIDSFYSDIFSGNFFYHTANSRNTNRGNHVQQRQVQQLPPDILATIMARLPASSIARFRSVCRDWYAMSRDPFIVSQHLVFAKKAYLAIHHGKYKQQVHLIEPTDSKNAVFRLGHLPTNMKIIGSSNGILCFRDDASSIYLYNPILDVGYLELPKRSTGYYKNHATKTILNFVSHVNYGFCFDHARSEFKVVIFIVKAYYKNREEEEEDEVREMPFLVETCTIPMAEGHLGTPQPWRIITSKVNINDYIYQHSEDPLIFLNRKFHCITSEKMITSFDIVSEEIISMPIGIHDGPDGDDDHCWGDLQIEELGGRLFATCIGAPCRNVPLDLWVMEDYGDPESWTKIMTDENIITPYIVNENEIFLSLCLYKIRMVHHTPSLVSIFRPNE